MAQFDVKCPHCNQELVAEEDWIGLEVECPTCKRTFTIAKNEPITSTENTNDGDTASTFTFVCPECGTQEELPITLKGQKYECKACCEESIAEPATEKKCPHCGQMIKLQAKICKFCKKNVDVSANSLNNLQSQTLSPVSNQAPPSLQSISKDGTPASNREALSGILWIVSIIMYLIGFICALFINGVLGFILIMVAFLLSVTCFLMKKGEAFELLPDEQILSTCRLVGCDNEDNDVNETVFYTRLTNKRIVLCAIEYPLLPIFITWFIEIIAKPKRVYYACEWNKVLRIETESKGGWLKQWHTVLETSDITLNFRTAPKLVDFWEKRKGSF